MSITYTWDIHGFEAGDVGGMKDVLQRVHIRRWGEHKDGTRWDENVVVEMGAPSPKNFSPYNTLTKDQIIGWVESILGADAIAEIDTRIAEEIEARRNPPIRLMDAPWKPKEEAA